MPFSAVPGFFKEATARPHGPEVTAAMRMLLQRAGVRPYSCNAASTRRGINPAATKYTATPTTRRSFQHQADARPWRPATILDEWVDRPARPISLRQLTFFGRSLTEERLISSANYVRTELPTRLAHRIRDLQNLPYVVVTNPHISDVYDLYYQAFDAFRRVPEIKTIDDNDRYCKIVSEQLRSHLPVIPNLAIGVLECQGLIESGDMDRFVNTMLRARISRRTIAEQHLALTETFNSPWHFPDATVRTDDAEFVGEVFLKCNAKEVVERCGKIAQDLARQTGGSDLAVPDIVVRGHLDATFPYIIGHLEYIIGELLRNSIQAIVERHQGSNVQPPPIEVLICEAPQHVIIRLSDRGGGIPREYTPNLWSFSKGPHIESRLRNLGQVPTMAATMQEMELALAGDGKSGAANTAAASGNSSSAADTSLSSLSSRPPHLRLGIGLPMSRVYAEYWAGSLELHSLEGYGVDAFLQISKLGNKNEQLTTRASMDAV